MFHDYLQNSIFYGNRNFLITQHKIDQLQPCFLKHGFVKAFWISRMKRARLFPLSSGLATSSGLWSRSPNNLICGWSRNRSRKLLDGGAEAGAWNFGSGSTARFVGQASCTNNTIVFSLMFSIDQIILEPQPTLLDAWIWSQSKSLKF